MKETLKHKVLAWHPQAYSIEMLGGGFAVIEHREFDHTATIGIGTTPCKAWANAWARIVHASQTKLIENHFPAATTRAALEEELKELESQAASIRELLAEMSNETP